MSDMDKITPSVGRGNIIDAVGEIDDGIIGECAGYIFSRGGARRIPSLRIAAAAACLCVAAGITAAVFLHGGQTAVSEPVTDEQGFTVMDGVLVGYSGEGGTVTVPDGVRSIAHSAFANCSKADEISCVKLGKNTEKVDNSAFLGLEGLSEIEIPAGNTAFVIRDGALLSADGTQILMYMRDDAESYVMPDTVKYVAAFAFTNHFELKDVHFSSALEFVGYNGFAGCGLRSLYLPDSLRELDDGAFMSCVYAVEGSLPDGVVCVGTEGRGLDGCFEYVPFYMEKSCGHSVPVGEWLRGEVDAVGCFGLSDRSKITDTLNTLISYYRADGSYDASLAGRNANALRTAAPQGASFPEKINWYDITVSPSQSYTVCAEFETDGNWLMKVEFEWYAPWDYYSWDECVWYAEKISFVSLFPENDSDETIGDWYIKYTDGGISFQNPARGYSFLEDRFTGPYRLTLSPGGQKFIVEYKGGESFFIEDFSGALYISWWSYSTPCVPYFAKANGNYVSGSAEWYDDDTVLARNENGRFLMKYAEYENRDEPEKAHILEYID